MVNINFYSLRLIKENGARYDIDKKISSPSAGYEAFKELFDMNTYAEEMLVMLTLNCKNIITGAFVISHGSLNASVVHPREVYKRALMNNSASIMIAHNHPSGDPTPSREDITITSRLHECGKILGIDLLDHIIIGDDKYISLKEKCLL